MKKRNWLVEDNLVALYIALYEHKDLRYESEEIEEIVNHKRFDMRVGNFEYLVTNGRRGLSARRPAPSWKQLYSIFKDFDQKKFAELVNLILEVKSRM